MDAIRRESINTINRIRTNERFCHGFQEQITAPTPPAAFRFRLVQVALAEKQRDETT
jgi:hypothetical protein